MRLGMKYPWSVGGDLVGGSLDNREVHLDKCRSAIVFADWVYTNGVMATPVT